MASFQVIEHVADVEAFVAELDRLGLRHALPVALDRLIRALDLLAVAYAEAGLRASAT